MIIENLTNDIKNNMELNENKNISYYVNIETDLNKLNKELDYLKQININELELNKIALFNQELLLFKEFQDIFIKSDVIYNNNVLVIIKPEHKALTRNIIKELKRIIKQLNIRKKQIIN